MDNTDQVPGKNRAKSTTLRKAAMYSGEMEARKETENEFLKDRTKTSPENRSQGRKVFLSSNTLNSKDYVCKQSFSFTGVSP